MKTCRECGIEQPLENFEVANRIKGVLYRRHLCKGCRGNQKKSRVRSISKVIRALRIQCEECGQDHPATLSFHHTRDKEINIADATRKGWGVERIAAEIEKCIVLCHNCHAIHHWEEKNKPD